MEQMKLTTNCAGIDVSKRRLDVGLPFSQEAGDFSNAEAGFVALEAWLRARGVRRVGMEATGGYEQALCQHLQAAGFEVMVFQPKEVRMFARFRRIKAKTDKIDARVIGLAAMYVEAVKAANDPRLNELAERLTAYEQAADQLKRMKTCREHVRLADLKADYAAEIARLAERKKRLARDLLRRLQAHDDLVRRYRLLRSIPGFGPLIAAVLVIRMPELGDLEQGQAASLIGVAPFSRDSGQQSGRRFIQGGRERPRTFLYLAALAAKRSAGLFKALHDRLLAAGKLKKVAIVAVMRKLIEAANLVLKRQQPWIKAIPA